MLPSGLLKIVGVCQGHLDYTARSCHFYSVVTTFTRLGKVPTLRAIGKRAEVTDHVERLDFDRLRRAFPFAQAAIERKRHYGEPMRWAIK